MDEYREIDEKEEYLLDEINGSRGKKPVMAILNKKKLTKFEMDDLFNPAH